jgi:hypothetical protein
MFMCLAFVPVLLLAGAAPPSNTKAAKRPTPVAAPAPAPVPEPVVVTPPEPPATPPVDEAARKKPLRIAVYRLESAGIDERAVRVTEESLLAELRKLQRASVLSLDEVKALLDLEAEKQLLGCSESSCLAEIAEALGADALVTGGVTQVGDAVTVAWKRIDPSAAAVVQTFTRQLTAAGGEELLAVVGPGVEELFPELPLRAGQVRGVAPEVAVRLNPPPLPPAAFWSAAGATGAVAVATAGAGVVWFTSESTLRSTFETAKGTAVPAQTVLDQQAQVQISNAAFWALVGVTGAGVITTGFMFPFTDWQNFGSEQ